MAKHRTSLKHQILRTCSVHDRYIAAALDDTHKLGRVGHMYTVLRTGFVPPLALANRSAQLYSFQRSFRPQPRFPMREYKQGLQSKKRISKGCGAQHSSPGHPHRRHHRGSQWVPASGAMYGVRSTLMVGEKDLENNVS